MYGLNEIDESVIERIKKVIEMKNDEKVNITKTFNTFWLRSEESELEFRVSRLGNVKIIISTSQTFRYCYILSNILN